MDCDVCDVKMQQVDNRFGSTSRSKMEFQCPECGKFRERDRYGGR